MNNRIKVIISSVIAAVVVSLLYLIVPVTDTFIVSHIFAMIAIGGIAISLCVFGKGNNRAPQGFAYIYTAIAYAIISTIVSVIACIAAYYKSFSAAVTIIVHIVILAVFVIRCIALSSGNEHIVKIDEAAEKKHKELEKEKSTYWK